MRRFYIGVDLGQVNDYTAFTIIERSGKEYHLRHIERPQRGTTYPNIVARLKELTETPELTGSVITLVVDVTGVGRPVWDLIKAVRMRVNLQGISITGGNTVNRDRDIYTVPKRDRVSSLQVAFQNGELKIAKGLPDGDTLVKELTNFKVKISASGHDQYEAWREGIHDDLVLSAAMAIWMSKQNSFAENFHALIS